MDALLKDPKTTTVRLVTNAEKIVIKETQRAFMYFGLYGFTVDAVIVNRLLPEGMHDPFFDKWRKTQGLFLEEAHRYFDPVPLFTLPLRDDQVLGPAALRSLGAELWAGRDAAASFRSDAPYRYTKQNGRYVLTLDLPFVAKEDVDLAVASGDLVVRIGNVRHHVPIPRTLAGYHARPARRSRTASSPCASRARRRRPDGTQEEIRRSPRGRLRARRRGPGRGGRRGGRRRAPAVQFPGSPAAAKAASSGPRPASSGSSPSRSRGAPRSAAPRSPASSS